MKHYKPVKVILIAIPIIILAILAYKDICPSGQLKIEYDFCKDSPFFSKLSPKGRVLDIERRERHCEQKMVIDPVYFDIRLPQNFQQAELTIWYQKSSPDVPFRIGPGRKPQDWSWDLQDIKFQIPDQLDKTWSVGLSSFDISKNRFDNNRLRFLISSPNLDTSGEHILIKRIQIKFTKPPLSWNNLSSRVKNFF